MGHWRDGKIACPGEPVCTCETAVKWCLVHDITEKVEHVRKCRQCGQEFEASELDDIKATVAEAFGCKNWGEAMDLANLREARR